MALPKDISPWAWVAAVAGAGLVWLAWHQYATDEGDASWTDPHQPPDMVAPAVGTSTGRILRSEPYACDYPASLYDWNGCCIGTSTGTGLGGSVALSVGQVGSV